MKSGKREEGVIKEGDYETPETHDFTEKRSQIQRCQDGLYLREIFT